MPCPDRPLGVQLGGHVGPPDQVRPVVVMRLQVLVHRAHRLLAGADHDVVDLEQPGLAVHGDVQAGVVDPVVGRPR